MGGGAAPSAGCYGGRVPPPSPPPNLLPRRPRTLWTVQRSLRPGILLFRPLPVHDAAGTRAHSNLRVSVP